MSTSKHFGRLAKNWMQRTVDVAGKRRKERRRLARLESEFSMFRKWNQRRKTA